MHELLFKAVRLVESGVEIVGNLLCLASHRKSDCRSWFQFGTGDQILARENYQVVDSPMLDLQDCGDVLVQTNRSFR